MKPPRPKSLRGALASLAMVATACGTSSKVSTFGPSEDAGLDAVAIRETGPDPSDVTLANPDTGATPLDKDAACAAVRQDAATIPVALFIMQDKSSSLSTGQKWDAARGGLGSFLKDPTSKGLRVAMGFFPRAADATPACSSEPYKVPKVDFGTLEPPTDANGQVLKLLQTLSSTVPEGTSTPTYPALSGALQGVAEYIQNHPNTAGAALLVTDGEPAGPPDVCSGTDVLDPANIAVVAATALARFGVRTYVVGLQGATRATVDRIAAAGGTTKAYYIGSTNAQVEFEAALASIRGDVLPCEIALPSDLSTGKVAFDQVNVALALSGANSTTLGQSTDCSGEGWRYDANPPTKIVLCPSTCDVVKKSPSASIEVLLGCQTVIK